LQNKSLKLRILGFKIFQGHRR